MSLFNIFSIIFICLSNFALKRTFSQIETCTSEDWDCWQVAEGKIKTSTSEDWDYWEYKIDDKVGRIQTYNCENWDYWQVDGGKYTIRTYTADDWDYWEIRGHGMDCSAKTYTSKDWDYWEFSGTFSGTIRTNISNDWDQWNITGDISKLNPSAKAAIFFVPIFTSSIFIQGLLNQE